MFSSIASTLLMKLPIRGSRGEGVSKKDQRRWSRDSLVLSLSTIVYTSAVSSSQARWGVPEGGQIHIQGKTNEWEFGTSIAEVSSTGVWTYDV